MMRAIWLLVSLILPGAAWADTLVAVRTMRSQTILSAADISLIEGDIPGTYTDAAAVIGLEARVVLYAGRPIRLADLGPAALVDRNQIVTLVYRRGVLEILAEGRALARGGVGDAIRVMNLGSRTTVTAIIASDGTLLVAGS